MVDSEKEDLSRKAYDAGFRYERDYKGCAQCAFAALQDVLQVRNAETDAIFKAATGFAAGGSENIDGVCGGYAAGIMMLGYFIGRERDNFSDPDKVRRKTYALVCELHRKFIDEYGTVICSQIHTKTMGRPFFIKDQEEAKKFEEAGAHKEKCTRVVALAAQWSAEIIERFRAGRM